MICRSHNVAPIVRALEFKGATVPNCKPYSKRFTRNIGTFQTKDCKHTVHEQQEFHLLISVYTLAASHQTPRPLCTILRCSITPNVESCIRRSIPPYWRFNLRLHTCSDSRCYAMCPAQACAQKRLRGTMQRCGSILVILLKRKELMICQICLLEG